MNIFNEIIKSITPILQPIGFSKKGTTYYIEGGKNYGVVSFQKSRDSTSDLVKFTINFGVYSDILGQLQYDYNSSAKPSIEQCHWVARVGSFMHDSPDYWWNINASDNLRVICIGIIETVQSIVIPEINKRISDEGLIKCWMNDTFAGTTEFGRFKFLTTLLKAKGDLHNLNHVVEIFMEQSKGKPNSSRAIEHLKEIKFI